MISRVFFAIFCLFASTATASELCFIAREKDLTIKQEGECTESFAPGSTFKIPLAVMGFNSEILTDSNHPVWSHKPEYGLWINSHKGDHTPKTWIRDFVLWYSKQLTPKLGMEKFQGYLEL